MKKRKIVRVLSLASSALFLASLATSQTVCIDPGHPSEVGRGTQGKKITEIRAVWLVAKFLKEELEAQGYEVVLTKSSEGQFVKNKRRSEIANKANSSLMIRLHCDSQGGSGFAVYVPTKAGKSQGKTGPSKEVISASGRIGREFHRVLKRELEGKLNDNGFLSDLKTAVGAKQGALTGSIFSEVPVVLVEMCRLSNAKDDAFIAKEDNQRFYAKALATACRAALNKNDKAKAEVNLLR
jgi:N-acetylmuramoyl-L-alanine amidase